MHALKGKHSSWFSNQRKGSLRFTLV